jgi:hypothetical protein
MSAIFAQSDVAHFQAAHLDTMQDQPQTVPGVASPEEFMEIRLPAKTRALSWLGPDIGPYRKWSRNVRRPSQLLNSA